jgi:lysophospholipase L1-like esterase
MATKEEMIEIIRAENPTGLRTGSDEAGYTDLTTAEYEATIAEWAEARLAKEAKIAADLAEAEAKAIAKTEAAEKLTAIGLTAEDLKALGL